MSSSKNHPKMRSLQYPARNDIQPPLVKVQDIRVCFKKKKKTPRKGSSIFSRIEVKVH